MMNSRILWRINKRQKELHLKNLSMKCLSKNKLFNGDPSFKKTVLLFPEIYRSNSDLLDFNDSDNEVYETNNETDNNFKKKEF